MLTAARAAKATGARTLILDEPHLYLHPGLERRLIRELTRPDYWHGAPLQLIVATHSPAFVDAAWADGQLYALDWTDRDHTAVSARDVTATRKSVEAQRRDFWSTLRADRRPQARN
jgi:predicted ATP-dependent endonuclease of OLD family